MSWDDRGNSAEAWDAAYAPGGHWDQVGGDAITEAFGSCLLEHLTDEVHLDEARVLDWGCGRGQITGLIRERFPGSYAVGMDFSRTAVSQALRRYGPPFIYAPRCEVLGVWDVIVNSNTLEHMADPLSVVAEHLPHCETYVILTPHEEDLGPGAAMTVEQRVEAGHAHVQRFSRGWFPQELEDAECIQREVVVPGPAWPGEQLLVVYRCRR